MRKMNLFLKKILIPFFLFWGIMICFFLEKSEAQFLPSPHGVHPMISQGCYVPTVHREVKAAKKEVQKLAKRARELKKDARKIQGKIGKLKSKAKKLSKTNFRKAMRDKDVQAGLRSILDPHYASYSLTKILGSENKEDIKEILKDINSPRAKQHRHPTFPRDSFFRWRSWRQEKTKGKGNFEPPS